MTHLPFIAASYGLAAVLVPLQLVAGHLTEADVTAVAAWLATRPAPANPAPVPKGTYALPFGCGSQPN